MITYFDTSSLLKLIVEEPGSKQVGDIWDTSEVVASVSLISVEARAALAAATRAGRLTTAQHLEAKRLLEDLVAQLTIIEVIGDVVASAADLAESEALRGYDAIHLAAALAVDAGVFTSADTALCDAAARHGLYIANPIAD